MPPISCSIRLARPGDGARLAEIYRPAVVSVPTSFEATPPDGAEMARRIDQILTRYPWLVASDGPLLLGYAYACPHRERAAYGWSVEVSAYVDPAAQRRGIGRRLYTSLFAILALQGYQNAYAGIAQPNPASVALHQAVGFTLVGTYRRVGFKHGAWRDVSWYERALGDYPAPPAPPRPLPDVTGDPGFADALAAGERLPA